MALLVEEIMNHELFYFRPDESVDDALACLRSLGIGGAPVVDPLMYPLGMLSLRDARRPDESRRVDDHMTVPVIHIGQRASIDEAARLMAESGRHHLVVTDERGRAVGMLSSLDVVRGLVGLPAAHPAAFPHLDGATGLVWTDEARLAAEPIEQAPDGPGVLVLTHGGRAQRNRAVWMEASANLRERLLDLLGEPQTVAPLAQLLRDPDLWFRVAHTADVDEARRVAARLLREAHGLGAPAGRP